MIINKKLVSAAILALSFNLVNAQGLELDEVRLVGGKNFSNFMFKDSDNQKDQQLSYNMLNSFGVNLNFKSDKHVLRPELLFRQAGATSDFNGTPLSWKMNYIDINVAYLYEALSFNIFTVSPGIAIGGGYMMNGEQYIGENRISIIEEESMKRFDLGFHGIASIKANVSQQLYLSLEYRGGMGIIEIETDDTQTTRNVYHSAILGIGFKLGQKTSSRFQ